MQGLFKLFQPKDLSLELDNLSEKLKTDLKNRGIVADAVVSRDGQTTNTYWHFICFKNEENAVAVLTQMKQAVGDADKAFTSNGLVTYDEVNYPSNPYRIRVSSEQMQTILKAMPELKKKQTPQNK